MRFCAFVIDKSEYPLPTGVPHFELYLNTLSMVLHNNLKKFESEDRCMIFGDEITQPKRSDTYENMLRNKLLKRGTAPEKIFGISRLESHASIFIQVTDILLGCVVHSFENETPKGRKVSAIRQVQEKLGEPHVLNDSITYTNPNYFSIWRYRSNQ